MKARYLSLLPFICWRQVKRPLDWPQYFGRSAPLEIEIGFGNGEFLVRRAQHHPERNFVGLELAWASVQRGLRKIAQAGITNVRLLQVDARVALERLVYPQSLTRAYALFPCPWPKERHLKRRLFSTTFLQLLNSRLLPSGEVQIVTDYRPYVQWVLTQIPGTGFATRCRQVTPHFSTKYERKWFIQGQKQFYEILLTQQDTLSIPVQEEVALRIHRVASFDPECFHPVGTRGEIAIEFKDFLFDPKQQRGLVRVFVAEENLTQGFWIEIAHGDGPWYIRPARGCALVPTVGVQRALDLVYDATCQKGPLTAGPRCITLPHEVGGEP